MCAQNSGCCDFSPHVFKAPSFFFFIPGHLLDFHSTGGRSEKRWMRAYRRAISTNKVNKARHQIIVYVLFVPQLLPLISLCSIKPFFTFLPFSLFLHLLDSYIIKLFDRSVDLAQFNTSTPLYPICRAWMRNNPSVREPAASPSPSHSMVEEEVRPFSYLGPLEFSPEHTNITKKNKNKLCRVLIRAV